MAAALPERKLLRAETWTVMAVGFLSSAFTALLLLLRYLVEHDRPDVLPQYFPSMPGLDVVTHLLISVVELTPVLLVWHLLVRSKERFASIGLTKPRWIRDGLTTIGLVVVLLITAAVISGVVMALLHTHPATRTASRGLGWGYLPAVWATSVRTAILEEVLVCGYLLHRLRQLGWRDGRAMAASVAVRCSYHVYGGVTLVLFTVVFGVVMAALWQRTNRLTVIIATHAIYDGVLFTLALAFR